MITRGLYLAISTFLLASCNQNADIHTRQPAKKNIDSVIPAEKTRDSVKTVSESPQKVADTNNIYNNVASVLSGFKGAAGNLNYLFDTLAWKEHATFIEKSWKKLEEKRLNAMKEWGRKEFEKPNSESKTVFYPFSGPDYISAHAFFPKADKYIMLGLEPVGKLPELQNFKPGEAREYSEDFKKSLSDIFNKSYFITRKMLHDFKKQKVNGLLPVLTFFIKRSGNHILDIKYLVRFKQDSISEVPYEYNNDEHKPFGVKVDFLQEGKQKSVYYFRYDVSDKLFNDTTAFYKYLNERTNGCLTYIKSASYLLHSKTMSNMRDLILKNSTAVIQDDTGIPFKYFEEGNKFDIKLYGQYVKPVSDFPYLNLQKPLQEAFRRDSLKVGKLPFHLGYHWGSKKDVIIYAQRK